MSEQTRAKLSAKASAARRDLKYRAARWPHLQLMTPEQKADYQTLMKNKYSMAEALAAIRDR